MYVYAFYFFIKILKKTFCITIKTLLYRKTFFITLRIILGRYTNVLKCCNFKKWFYFSQSILINVYV